MSIFKSNQSCLKDLSLTGTNIQSGYLSGFPNTKKAEYQRLKHGSLDLPDYCLVINSSIGVILYLEFHKHKLCYR